MIDRIGDCRVIDEIGSGGMAVIYKAVQESLNRVVAIKALKTSVAADAQFAVRFEREALSMATLQHENILHIYDFQRMGGAMFIVMELVEGIDLYDLLEKCTFLPIDVAAIIAMQVARALDYAHYRGIVHRDVKPANIMVAKSGGVKLMDFGIARDRSFGDLTEQGTGLGTPSYMSPEQILGDRLDFRSDIFSLGVVLYQMVCGQKPFIEDEEKSVMHKIRLEKYPAPRRLNPDVPWELERILARAMAKRREDRYASTQDFVIALERFIARRCHMNYKARIVQFLRDQELISDVEAGEYLHPAGAGFYQKVRNEAPLGASGLRRLLTLEGALLGGMLLAGAFVHVSPIGAAEIVAPSASTPGIPATQPPPRAPGYLRVVAEPWAEVWIDGALVETTPFTRPLALGEGKHRVELKNPAFASQTRDITVDKGKLQTLRVTLVRK